MNKDYLKAFSLLKVTLDGEDITLSDVFVTGDAIASWQTERATIIDLGSWHWHKNCDSKEDFYIVTGRKALG